MSTNTPLDAYQQLFEAAQQRDRQGTSLLQPVIHVGMATCGIAAGALETLNAFEEALAEQNLEAELHPVGCMGHCYGEPVVVIEYPGFPPIMYHEVSAGKARMLAKFFLGEGDPRFEHVFGATQENDMIPTVMEFARFNQEKRIVMEKCGQIDPEQIDEYIALGGYKALAQALARTPREVIQEVKTAGLRGRGGAGFPTWRKWDLVQQNPAEVKTFICNADEGDPGAYMDRTLLESNPHQVIEGMVIGAFATGAKNAVLYVRAEYPLAVKILTKAIDQAKERRLLGVGILETDFALELEIFQGSGAFICGEETALLQSLEGQRGMPQVRPPFPVEKGLFKRPSVINNVKTLASIPPIITESGQWYRSVGTADSPGTAIFSVVGSVVHPGLVEIEMGMTLRTIIFDICGGIPNQKAFRAVQIGGPSGGCLSEEFLDTPIDFDSLIDAGAMMGSGGMVVMDEDACMVDVSRYFLDFTDKESCGKCTFCRIGTHHLHGILQRISQGDGTPEDLPLLRTLGEQIKGGSLCGLGKTAPNPVLTSLRYFEAEYKAHIDQKCCPAGMCRPLTAYYIDLDKCARGCDICIGCCPVDAVFTTRNRKKGIDQSLCVKCGECMVACPPDYDAVRKVSPMDHAPIIERPTEPPPE